MSEVERENWPTIGVVGIAGPVVDNTCKLTNITHWPTEDGKLIASSLPMESFRFINDFTAASFGTSTLTHKDYTILGSTGEAII